jgi:Type VI secretion system/phage-baseplate injector OB domain
MSIDTTDSAPSGALAASPNPEPQRYFGKYRGSVVTNVDPVGQGRLLVRVPDVVGVGTTSWAMPCVPVAGPGMGTYIVPPPVGAGVWVEFEQGNPRFPIWVGCFWDTPPVPPGTAGTMAQVATKTAPGTPMMTMEVVGAGVAVTQVPVVIASQPGMVTLYCGPASSITLSPTGISLSAPMVSVTTAKFSVNETHLLVV